MDPVTEPVDWDTPTQVYGKWVTVERQLNRDDESVIATIEVTTDADGPVTVEVADVFPEEWAAEDVGVHPDFVPENFVADPNRFEFTDIVEPDEPIEVVYGVKLGTIESIQPPGPPVIESERGLENLLDAPEEDPIEADGGNIDRESTRESDDGDVESAEAIERDRRPISDAARREAESDRSPTRTRPRAGEDVDEDADDQAVPLLRSSVDADSDERPTTSSDLLDRLSAVSEAVEGLSDDPDVGSRSDSSGSSDTSDEADGDDDFRFDRRADEADEDDVDLVDALADELGSRDASDEAVAGLRKALGGGSSKRDEVRLNHLQSRVEEFAAYADMLGDIIDEHGSLQAYFDDQQSRVSTVEADLDDVRTELDEAGEDRDTLRNRLAATSERVEAVDDVADDIEAVREEIGQVRRDHRQELDDLGSAVDAIESVLDGSVDGLESKVTTLQDRVEAWDQTRQRLADALGSASESGPDKRP